MDTNIDTIRTVWSQIGVSEHVKQSVNIIIKKLLSNETFHDCEFPSSFTAIERQFVHNYCAQMGLKTKSNKNGLSRSVIAFKPDMSTIVGKDGTFSLMRISQHQIMDLLRRCPITEKERKDMATRCDRTHATNIANNSYELRELNCTTGRLNSVIPQIPCPPPFASGRDDTMTAIRKNMPIWKKRDDIMELIAKNRIVVISGQTGSGKTTQVPQYILEFCNLMKKPCRIICAQPRRLLALAVSERVSAERGEVIGQTVGYQIRLESKVSPRTLLTFCTNGVLLRTLMGGDNALNTVTHIILDEIHERDRFTDFLLLIMKEFLNKYRNVKLIMMCAKINLNSLTQFFGNNCPSIEINFNNSTNGRYLFLEDILKIIDYMSPSMKQYKDSIDIRNKQKLVLKDWCDRIKISINQESMTSFIEKFNDSDNVSYDYFREKFTSETIALGIVERVEMDASLTIKIDNYMRNAWFDGTDKSFQELIDLIITEQISVDYKHSDSGITPLIIATCHNKFNVVETLLSYGANVKLVAPNDWDALKWAKHFRHKQLTHLLEAYWKCNSDNWSSTDNIFIANNFGEFTIEQKQILDTYYHSLNDSGADIDLICALIYFICANSEKLCCDNKNGSILVFLNGYDEIIKLRERILADTKRFDANKYALFTIHLQMQSTDLRKVFRHYTSSIRKIILSTHIAETSISIDDVAFVIDCGKVSEKSYEMGAEFPIYKSVWISKWNASLRRETASRYKNGICYHLYDRSRFQCLDEFRFPDMLRMSIHELCLQTRLLSPTNLPICDFLSKALSPPSLPNIKKSVQLLKTIDALDSMEQLTELGLHLLDLPIEPNLGKMVLYSVVLKCLDPVLTIVCSLAYCNPFIVPTYVAARKRTAAAMRKKLAAGTFSDHITLLRGFQNWQKARHDGYEKSFCEQNFISSATMEMIVGMRAQLLGQLRASGFVRARGVGDIRDLNTNSENWAVIKSALCGGGYPNIMRVDRDRNQLVTKTNTNVRFHPSSVMNPFSQNPKETIDVSRARSLHCLPTDWLMFENITKVGSISYASCCTLLTPITIALFAGNAVEYNLEDVATNGTNDQYDDQDSDSESEHKTERIKHVFKIDNWNGFKVDKDIASLTLKLRLKWQSMFLRRMCSPSKPMPPSDDFILKAIVEVLTVEEQNLGLQQPVGIGQRPRPMSTDFCPPVSNISLNSPISKNALNVRQQQFASPQQIPNSFIGSSFVAK